jgi:hypothetical protein
MTDNTNVEVDAEYTFNLEDETNSNYKVSKRIVEWLKTNMEGLTDSNKNLIFSKVNYGYNENTIKGFGKKPVCDVYINNYNYNTDFTHNIPVSVNSFIICYLKGNMNNAYLKACELTDYLIQEFNDNESFRRLTLTNVIDQETVITNIVRDTFIRNVELQVIPGSKTYGVLCAFELEHELIR